MPRTLTKVEERVNVRFPKPMIDLVDQIVDEHPELFNNRQQYMENALRQRLEQDMREPNPKQEAS